MAVLTVQTLSEFLDTLESHSTAVEYGQCFCKILHIERNKALTKQRGLQSLLHCVSKGTWGQDIKWRKEQAIKYHRKIDLAISKYAVITDVSNEGWASHFESLSTSGQWHFSKINLHINAKELLAVRKSLEALCADIHSSTILIKFDNSTITFYLYERGGCRSLILIDTTKDIFLLAVPRNIQLVAAHIQGKLNLDIDLLLRSFSHETEWMFDQKVFNKICRNLLKHETDLMASSSDTQLPSFISWKANRNAISSNVFHMLWENNKAYIFQFFSLITKARAKVEQDQTHLIKSIAHFWKTQPCFLWLLKLLATTHLLLPKSKKLHSVWRELQLIEYHSSGKVYITATFQTMLKSLHSSHGEHLHKSNINRFCENGTNSALNNQSIPFNPLLMSIKMNGGTFEKVSNARSAFPVLLL